jgi:pilus assembly protein CpaD
MSMKDLLRLASLAALLLSGSCATPTTDAGLPLTADGQTNHPITVEPSYTSLKLPFSASDAGLLPDDAAKLQAFVADYLSHGNGAISVTAPEGPDGQAAINYFGDRLAAMGVPPSRILVGQHDSADQRVEIGYVTYQAKTDPCGDWSQDASQTFDNQTMPDFGCSVQHNVAAMVANPRDLEQPRTQDAEDQTRRGTVMGNYEKGQPTPAALGPDQKAAVSDMSN